MKEMQVIIEGNKMIAEFMAIPKCDRCEPSEYCERYKFGPSVFYSPEEMKYHTSYDWLMEVIKKIQSETLSGKIEGTSIELHFWTIDDFQCGMWNETGWSIKEVGKDPVKVIYQSVLKFIEFYKSKIS